MPYRKIEIMKKVFVILFSLVAIFAAYCWRGSFFAFVLGDKSSPLIQLQTYSSPDGQYIVTVYFKDNWRTDHEADFHTYVTIRPNIGTIHPPPPAEVERDDTIISLSEKVCVDCEWINANTLKVRYFDSEAGPARLLKSGYWHNVSIEYIQLVERPTSQTREK